MVGAVSAKRIPTPATRHLRYPLPRLQVVGGQLQLKDGVSLDHEAEPNVTLTLTATDQGGLAHQQERDPNVANPPSG